MFVATSWRARLLGLAFLQDLPEHCALSLPRCSSVHTFGMRFPIDVMFVDRRGRVLRLVRGVPPCRVLHCRGAAETIEWRSRRSPAR